MAQTPKRPILKRQPITFKLKGPKIVALGHNLKKIYKVEN